MKKLIPVIGVLGVLAALVWWKQAPSGAESQPEQRPETTGVAESVAVPADPGQASPSPSDVAPALRETATARWVEREKLTGNARQLFDELHAWMSSANLNDEQRTRILSHIADAMESLRRVRQDVARGAMNHEPRLKAPSGETYAHLVGDELRTEIGLIVTPDQLAAFDDRFPSPGVLAAFPLATRVVQASSRTESP